MMNFFTPLIQDLISGGHQVDIACNEENSLVPDIYHELGCKITQLSCTRSPFNPGTIKTVQQLRSLIRQSKYDVVHCHSPIASICTRLACWNLPCKVIYTAHGFHFYKGAPLTNWLLYYTAEKICAPLTDILITINKEDYALALNKLKAKQVLYIPGVGIDLNRFHSNVHTLSRDDFDIPENNRVLLSVGQLIKRKNHEVLINAAAQLENVTVLIAGEGPLDQHLKELANQTGCDLRLLGQRNDIAALCNICDLFVLPSFQEGLPVALMEAMACGKAVACSKIRGNTDLLDESGGIFFDPHSVDSCRDALATILKKDLDPMGHHNREAVSPYSIDKVNNLMLQIYESQT